MQDVRSSWGALAHGLSGTFCGSLNFLDSAEHIAQPAFVFQSGSTPRRAGHAKQMLPCSLRWLAKHMSIVSACALAVLNDVSGNMQDGLDVWRPAAGSGVHREPDTLAAAAAMPRRSWAGGPAARPDGVLVALHIPGSIPGSRANRFAAEHPSRSMAWHQQLAWCMSPFVETRLQPECPVARRQRRAAEAGTDADAAAAGRHSGRLEPEQLLWQQRSPRVPTCSPQQRARANAMG